MDTEFHLLMAVCLVGLLLTLTVATGQQRPDGVRTCADGVLPRAHRVTHKHYFQLEDDFGRVGLRLAVAR